MNIILSIKPELAAKIYSGEKCVEWRKTKPKNFRHCDMCFLYETAPVKRITGFLMLDGIAIIKPENLDKCHDLIKLGCEDLKELKKYAGEKAVYGWLIKCAYKFSLRNAELKEFGLEKAPQSWVYFRGEVLP